MGNTRKETERIKVITKGEQSDFHEYAERWSAIQEWEMLSQTVAFEILDALSQRSWNQTDLAKKMGVSRQYVSKLVSGRENLSLEQLAKINNAFERNILKFVDNESERRRSKVEGANVYMASFDHHTAVYEKTVCQITAVKPMPRRLPHSPHEVLGSLSEQYNVKIEMSGSSSVKKEKSRWHSYLENMELLNKQNA